MHVAIVCPYSYALPGGVQEYTKGLARALAASGHEVSLFAPDVRDGAGDVNGVLTVSLGRALRVRANGSVVPVGLDPRMLVRLDLALDPADVVHVHEPFQPPSIAATLRAPRGVPIVGTFHAAADRSLPYAVAAPLLRRIAPRFTATTASSPASRALARRYVDVDPQIIPNGIDYDRFAGAQPDRWMRELGRTVLFVGRAEPRKGFEVLARAFAGLQAGHPDLHLVATVPPGSAPGLGPRAHLLGPQPPERVASMFRAADLFCAPNLGRESFGIVLAEAMAAGAAVVASDIAGFRFAGGDAVEYSNAGDADALRNAIVALLSDDRRRDELVARGREQARMFDWSVISKQMLALYERVAAAA